MTTRAKQLGKNKHERRFYDCPGAWVGNMPGSMPSIPNSGSIVVDAEKAIMAIRFLNRYYTLTGSSAYDQGGAIGLTIQFETKGAEWVPPVDKAEYPEPVAA